MQAHLQATGLNVWRVVSEGVKNNIQQEKQHDVTASYPRAPDRFKDLCQRIGDKIQAVLR
jgi:hypothetical protein